VNGSVIDSYLNLGTKPAENQSLDNNESSMRATMKIGIVIAAFALVAALAALMLRIARCRGAAAVRMR
jgi:hypothetical protein